MTNLIIGRQATSCQLPDKDSHFEGASDFPDILSVCDGCTLNQFLVEGLGRKMPRRLKGPGHTILPLRGMKSSEFTQQRHPVLPFTLTKGSTKMNIPRAIPPELIHRSMWLSRDLKQPSKALSKRTISYPPVSPKLNLLPIAQ
jgi:hypothetical protein